MNILICASGNSGRVSPFVLQQAESLRKLGIKVDLFLIIGRGIGGYLKNYFPLIKQLNSKKYNLIHAHYGFSGLLATFQWKVPVIITFHGSDINKATNYPISFLASRLSDQNIFVHPSQPHKLKIYHKNNFIIPCGVDLSTFYPTDKNNARTKLNWDQSKTYILFSSHFHNPIKNVNLALDAIKLSGKNIELIELKDYSKEEVSLLMNGVDLLLVTSLSETGPIVVKEAMACNCPIVSTDVGDVRIVINKTNLCFVTNFNPKNISKNINTILQKQDRSNGRNFILDYDVHKIAEKLKNIYTFIK